MPCVLQRSETYATVVNFLCIKHGPHLPEVRVVVGGYPVTAWRTTCLYGVSDSWASPRLFAYVTSSTSGTDRTLPEVRVVVGGYPVTAWRTTCLYGVSDSWASPRLFAYVTSSASGTDRTLFEVQVMEDILSPHGALRAYMVFLTAEPRRGSLLM